MKRSLVPLVAILALVLAACGSQATSATAEPTTSAATSTPVPTPEPVATPTPAATDDGTGSGPGFTGELSDALPDEVGGLPRQDAPSGMEQLFAGLLSGQGLDPDALEFVYGTWGSGEIFVTGFRVEGMPAAQLDLLARAMAGASAGGQGPELDTEQMTVGGKDVLRMTPPEGSQAVYVYQVGDAFFSVVTDDVSLAEDLLSQLP